MTSNLILEIETIAIKYISKEADGFNAFEMEAGYREILMLLWKNAPELVTNTKKESKKQ